MAKLSDSERKNLPDSAFAYVDSRGARRLPIYDEPHVRNALARFDQVKFETEAARDKARKRLLQAAKKHGIVPVGFVTAQLETERVRVSTSAGALPSGFLTLLFTDIENSTMHLHRLGADYAKLLQKVRRTIRGAVTRAGGHAVELRADEAFVVFEDAAAAITGAVALQRDLLTATWPRGSEVRVRAGLHSGDVTLTEGGYVGIPVHTAARVAGAAHGGQILISGECRHAAGSPGPGMQFRSLGGYRFAGFSEPIPVYQVEAEGLLTEFPRPRTGTRVSKRA
jgi:class 3 adenylate cyclase